MDMDYGMLKEMPRFWIGYGIKFYTEEKSKIYFIKCV